MAALHGRTEVQRRARLLVRPRCRERAGVKSLRSIASGHRAARADGHALDCALPSIVASRQGHGLEPEPERAHRVQEPPAAQLALGRLDDRAIDLLPDAIPKRRIAPMQILLRHGKLLELTKYYG